MPVSKSYPRHPMLRTAKSNGIKYNGCAAVKKSIYGTTKFQGVSCYHEYAVANALLFDKVHSIN
jgi:hypothetical protein